MDDLKKMDQDALLDMLAAYTKKYIKMFKDGAVQTEFEACKDLINKISAEIGSRKKAKSGPENPA